MEFSFVIPCTPKSYSKDKILRIFDTLSVNIKKFDMILCTSKNNIGIQRSNIMLMNKDIKIRAYCSVNDASQQCVLREGVKHCQYSTVAILDLDKFTDENIADLSVTEVFDNDFAFNEENLEILSMYTNYSDLVNTLSICKDNNIRCNRKCFSIQISKSECKKVYTSNKSNLSSYWNCCTNKPHILVNGVGEIIGLIDYRLIDKNSAFINMIEVIDKRSGNGRLIIRHMLEKYPRLEGMYLIKSEGFWLNIGASFMSNNMFYLTKLGYNCAYRCNNCSEI